MGFKEKAKQLSDNNAVIEGGCIGSIAGCCKSRQLRYARGNPQDVDVSRFISGDYSLNADDSNKLSAKSQ